MFGKNIDKMPLEKTLSISNQMTFDAYRNIKVNSSATYESVKNKLQDINNYAKGNYTSLSSTISSWIRRDKKQNT